MFHNPAIQAVSPAQLARLTQRPEFWADHDDGDPTMDTTTDPMHDTSWANDHNTSARFVVQFRGQWRTEWRIWDTSEHTERRADPRLLRGTTERDYLLDIANQLNALHDSQKGSDTIAARNRPHAVPTDPFPDRDALHDHIEDIAMHVVAALVLLGIHERKYGRVDPGVRDELETGRDRLALVLRGLAA